MTKKRYKGLVIVFVLVLIFLLGNYYTKTVFANNYGYKKANEGSNYGMESNSIKNRNKTIIIGDDKDYPPYSFVDENNNPTGFNIEVAKAAAEAMGFNVKIKQGDWKEIRDDLENGRVDVIAGMFYSEDREKKYAYTTKYAMAVGEVFARNDTNINDITELKGATVVVKEHDIVSEYLKKQNLNIKFVEVSTVKEALELVSTNKYDYAAVLKSTGHYLIKKEKYSNLKDNGLVINPTECCLTVKKGNDDLLFSINGGLEILKATGKFDEIYNKWLSIYEQESFYDMLTGDIEVIVPFVAVIVLLALWSFTLKIKVNTRTKELLETNNALNNSQKALIASNNELESSFKQLAAIEEELRKQYEQLIKSRSNLKESEKRNRAIVTAIPDLIFIVGENAVFKDCETKDESMLIMPKSEFIGKTLWEVLPMKIAETAYKKIQLALQNNSLESFEYEVYTKNGNRHYELRLVKCRKNEIIAISRDITDMYIAQKSLEEEKDLLKTTLLSVGDGVIVTDIHGNITIFNKASEAITGWKEGEAKLLKFEDVFNIIDEDTKGKCDNPVKKALEGMKEVELVQYKILITKEYKEKIISYNVSLIKDNRQNIKGAVLVFRDVTSERKNGKEIKFLSYHDQLTGLYNRRFFEEELKRLNKKENLPLTIFMADVNGLKLINDSFGHAAGDELLKKVAKVISTSCGYSGTVSRIGGDEFVILLPKTDRMEADKIFNRISLLASKEQVASINVSISLGFATKYCEEEDISEITKKAEDFMYKKKLFESPSMRGKTISAIVNTLHEKNKREEKHSYRVSGYCDYLGKVMNLPDGEIQELKTAGLLHDIGKIAINDNILNKPDKLTEEEREELRRHPEIGYRILSSVNDMAEMAQYVLAHHERWDGSGYPKGLKGKEIPLKSRIIAVADAYDAMTSDRTYRKALPKEVAVKELIKNAGSQFDPEIVKIFVEKIIGVNI